VYWHNNAKAERTATESRLRTQKKDLEEQLELQQPVKAWKDKLEDVEQHIEALEVELQHSKQFNEETHQLNNQIIEVLERRLNQYQVDLEEVLSKWDFQVSRVCNELIQGLEWELNQSQVDFKEVFRLWDQFCSAWHSRSTSALMKRRYIEALEVKLQHSKNCNEEPDQKTREVIEELGWELSSSKEDYEEILKLWGQLCSAWKSRSTSYLRKWLYIEADYGRSGTAFR
jgi:DNA repair exonuclease SbcCD ATPase subunit